MLHILSWQLSDNYFVQSTLETIVAPSVVNKLTSEFRRFMTTCVDFLLRQRSSSLPWFNLLACQMLDRVCLKLCWFATRLLPFLLVLGDRVSTYFAAKFGRLGPPKKVWPTKNSRLPVIKQQGRRQNNL